MPSAQIFRITILQSCNLKQKTIHLLDKEIFKRYKLPTDNIIKLDKQEALGQKISKTTQLKSYFTCCTFTLHRLILLLETMNKKFQVIITGDGTCTNDSKIMVYFTEKCSWYQFG